MNFESWVRQNPSHRYEDGTIRRYLKALNLAEEWLGVSFPQHIMDITNCETFDTLKSYIVSLPNYEEVNKKHGNGELSAAMSLYRKYLINNELPNYEEVSVELDKNDNPDLDLDSTVIEYYSKDDFLNEVYISETQYNTLVSLLKNKLNVILQGPPGVGKTFAAKRLAYSIMGKKDDNRVGFVQFHQNYSYEDFVLGYRPSEGGFELRHGVFYQFCERAMSDPTNDYFFIIDEINRGNLSKVFGELLMLIEKDYRGKSAILAYNNASFTVPQNVYLIGMMNTADRSLAMIDYALRRRFGFYTMEPGFDSYGFKNYIESFANDKLNKVIEEVKRLNKAIASDKSLGKGFCIGHSYFCGHNPQDNDTWIKEVVDYDIIPMISEYWFDDIDSVNRWAELLTGAINA